MSTDWMGTRRQWEMSTKWVSRDRSMTGCHDPKVFETRKRRLEKPGEGRGASSTAPVAINGRVYGDEFRRERRRPEEGYAIPLPEDLHHPRNCARPSRPASGGTDSHRTGLGKAMAPTSENPKVSKKEQTPYHPWSACGLQSARRTQSAALTSAPEGTVARRTGERRNILIWHRQVNGTMYKHKCPTGG